MKTQRRVIILGSVCAQGTLARAVAALVHGGMHPHKCIRRQGFVEDDGVVLGLTDHTDPQIFADRVRSSLKSGEQICVLA